MISVVLPHEEHKKASGLTNNGGPWYSGLHSFSGWASNLPLVAPHLQASDQPTQSFHGSVEDAETRKPPRQLGGVFCTCRTIFSMKGCTWASLRGIKLIRQQSDRQTLQGFAVSRGNAVSRSFPELVFLLLIEDFHKPDAGSGKPSRLRRRRGTIFTEDESCRCADHFHPPVTKFPSWEELTAPGLGLLPSGSMPCFRLNIAAGSRFTWAIWWKWTWAIRDGERR